MDGFSDGPGLVDQKSGICICLKKQKNADISDPSRDGCTQAGIGLLPLQSRKAHSRRQVDEQGTALLVQLCRKSTAGMRKGAGSA
jgi:hypothetical protein